MALMERLLTSREVCDYFKIASSTLGRWRTAGKIIALRTPGGKMRFRESDVAKVLEEEAVLA